MREQLPCHRAWRALCSAVLALTLALAVLPAGVASASRRPGIAARTFCQTVDGYAVYVPVGVHRMPANTTGTITWALPQLGYWYTDGPYPISTDASGNAATSFGYGLSGLSDPLLGHTEVVTAAIGGKTASISLPLTCDPSANTPAARSECFEPAYAFWFKYVGFTAANRGDCVAYVVTHGRNPAGL